MMFLELVSKHHYEYLYKLLGQRTSDINISHKGMPSWQEHVKFCDSHPYPHRYICHVDSCIVGTAYITERGEIGIFIDEEYQHRGYGKRLLQLLMEKHKNDYDVFYANINPKNWPSHKLFSEFKFKVIQMTYALPSSEISSSGPKHPVCDHCCNGASSSSR